MAGIALYYNLEDRLALSNPIIIQHQLESVKILPPEGNNNPQLYGYITKQAISLAEIGHPKRNRVIAMAVTADQGNGLPSSWSGALDNLASGVDDGIKRLIIVSAGTVFPDEHKNSPYTKANELHAIEDPAQAWNVLTVGAYNEHIYFDEDFYQGYHPVAEPKQLSPYSSTSYTWDTKWPIKPDIVLSGGNILTDGINYTAEASLSLLTTSRNPLVNLFLPLMEQVLPPRKQLGYQPNLWLNILTFGRKQLEHCWFIRQGGQAKWKSNLMKITKKNLGEKNS